MTNRIAQLQQEMQKLQQQIAVLEKQLHEANQRVETIKKYSSFFFYY